MDTGVSYLAVGVTYIVVGCFGALAYHERDEGGAEPRTYPVADTCRDVALILHAVTFYPLMCNIYRQQVTGGLLRSRQTAVTAAKASVVVSSSTAPRPANVDSRSSSTSLAMADDARIPDTSRTKWGGYLQTFVVTLSMVGLTGGVAGAFPELDKEEVLSLMLRYVGALWSGFSLFFL